MNIGIGSIRTGIFTVADMSIMTGAGLLFLFLFCTRIGEP
jgi:lipoprotein signal peptidase